MQTYQAIYRKLNMKKVLIICLIFLIMFVSLGSGFIMADEGTTISDDEPAGPASPVSPEANQCLEMRATTITDVAGQNKQVIMELWGNNIEFKGFDVRFSYDKTKIKPSNLISNVPATDTSNYNEYFEFVGEFKNVLDFSPISLDTDNGVLWTSLYFNPPVGTETKHIKRTDNGGYIISTKDETSDSVMIGRMSFQMTEENFDADWFELVPSATTPPQTGVKIMLDGRKYLETEPSFIFTDMTASKNASLADLVLSTGEIDTEDPDNSTYKKYEFTPPFDKDDEDTVHYEVTLYEYLDTMDITATLSDENSTMKIKLPKRDEDDKLVYESDETTIVYEEQDLDNKVSLEFVLNKLGEPDTVLTIEVTAQNGDKKEYELVIKRPFGIIKGSVYIAATASKGMHKATVRVYKSDDVATVIDWPNVVPDKQDTIHQDLIAIDSMDYETNDDGTYEIYVVPGQYDILLDKKGYLDHIYALKEVNEGQTVEFDQKILLAGDVNKDGVVQLQDLTSVLKAYGSASTDVDYDENCDFNDDDVVQLQDYTEVLTNYSTARVIE